MRKIYLFIFLACLMFRAYAQYAPQVGLSGCTAISATSGQFVGWAASCTVTRGFLNIADTNLGHVSAGDISNCLGPADNLTVSLGDSGVVDMTFGNPIFNGPGPDFAVFANGFRNDTDSSLAFVQLAFVEVSSDGVNYFRFKSKSNTQSQVQIANGECLEATNLNNLAGKYIAMYGTPFDLDELAGTTGLDVNSITHIRVIDVIGSISGHSTHDAEGSVINDPYPTPFAAGGFNLDAVGVINQQFASVKQLADNVSVQVYPNPATDNILVSIKGATQGVVNATMTTITGSTVLQTSLSQAMNTIPVSEYPAGIYFLVLSDTNGNKWTEKVVRR